MLYEVITQRFTITFNPGGSLTPSHKPEQMMKKLTLVCLSLAIPCFMWGQKLDAAPKADKNLDVVLDNGMNVDKAAIERGTVVLNDDFEVGSGWTMGTVITSYSIHYTKLYDEPFRPFCPEGWWTV